MPTLPCLGVGRIVIETKNSGCKRIPSSLFSLNVSNMVISALRSIDKSSHTSVCCGLPTFASLEIPHLIHIHKLKTQKNASEKFSNAFVVVPRTRLELTRTNVHYPLKVACLPIPPPGPFVFGVQIYVLFFTLQIFRSKK